MNSQSPKRVQRKRGKLNLSKCDFCRKAKQKCEPTARVWPEKCLRCESKDFPCSANTRKRAGVVNFERPVPNPQQQGPLSNLVPASLLGQRTPALVPASDSSSTLSLTTLSNAVSLYKILQRASFKAEREFEDLARIGESEDEIVDCNGHIGDAAWKLRTRLLEVLSVRLLSARTEKDTIQHHDPSLEHGISATKLLTQQLLDNSLPVGAPGYYPPKDVFSRPEAEQTLRSTLLIVDVLEADGELGAALLLLDQACDQWPEAPISLISELTERSWAIQDKFKQTVFVLSTSPGLGLGLDPLTFSNILLRSHHPIVFDSLHWRRLLELPETWGYHDFLGSTVLHFIIERLDSTFGGAVSSVSLDDRARFIKRLMSNKNPSNIHSTDNYHRTPLHVAAQWNVVDVATALLNAGIDPDYATNTQRTALHYAASFGHAEMCEVLMHHGADVNAQTKGGNTPLMVALIRPDDTYKVFKHDDSVKFDITNCHGDNALHLAVIQANIAAVGDLLPECDDIINSRNNEGKTALCLAAQLENQEEAVEMVRTLLQSSNVEPRFRDNRGMTPLHRAAIRGNLEMCKLLGIRIDGGLKRDWNGKKASQLAARKGHTAIAKMLEDLEYLHADDWDTITTPTWRDEAGHVYID